MYRRIAHRKAQQQAKNQIKKDNASFSSTTLKTDASTAPINATRRLRRINTARAIKARRTSKNYWTPSHEQEWFELTRTHSNKILTIKMRQGPAHRRNLRTRNWHIAYAMDWLKNYDDLRLEGCDEAMPTEQDEM